MGLWKRIRDFAKSKHREKFLAENYYNLKCPHCNTWTSDCENDSVHSNFGHPIATRYICGQCEKPSYWVCEAGFWFPVDQFGITIQEQQP